MTAKHVEGINVRQNYISAIEYLKQLIDYYESTNLTLKCIKAKLDLCFAYIQINCWEDVEQILEQTEKQIKDEENEKKTQACLLKSYQYILKSQLLIHKGKNREAGYFLTKSLKCGELYDIPMRKDAVNLLRRLFESQDFDVHDINQIFSEMEFKKICVFILDTSCNIEERFFKKTLWFLDIFIEQYLGDNDRIALITADQEPILQFQPTKKIQNTDYLKNQLFKAEQTKSKKFDFQASVKLALKIFNQEYKYERLLVVITKGNLSEEEGKCFKQIKDHDVRPILIVTDKSNENVNKLENLIQNSSGLLIDASNTKKLENTFQFYFERPSVYQAKSFALKMGSDEFFEGFYYPSFT